MFQKRSWKTLCSGGGYGETNRVMGRTHKYIVFAIGCVLVTGGYSDITNHSCTGCSRNIFFFFICSSAVKSATRIYWAGWIGPRRPCRRER